MTYLKLDHKDSMMTDDVVKTTDCTFEDKNGLRWDCTLNLGIVLRVDRSDFSFYTQVEQFRLIKAEAPMLTELINNRPLVGAVVWVIVMDQAKGNYGIDPHQSKETYERAEQRFAASMDSAALNRAHQALEVALFDFFPSLKTVYMRLKESSTVIGQKLKEHAPNIQDQLVKMFDDQVSKVLEQTQIELGQKSSPTSPSQDSPGTKPADLPSGTST